MLQYSLPLITIQFNFILLALTYQIYMARGNTCDLLTPSTEKTKEKSHWLNLQWTSALPLILIFLEPAPFSKFSTLIYACGPHARTTTCFTSTESMNAWQTCCCGGAKLLSKLSGLLVHPCTTDLFAVC